MMARRLFAGGLRNRIVQRRGAERHEAGDRLGQRLQAERERRHFLKLRVEREDRRFVARRVEPAQNVSRGFARVRHVSFHAAADVEQQGQADSGGIAAKIGDGARLTAVEDFEVARAEILDEASLVIAHDRGDPNQVDARLETGDGWLLERRGGVSADRERHDNGAGDEFAPHHQPQLVRGDCQVVKY